MPPAVFPEDAEELPTLLYPPYDFSGRSRRVGEYSGYTIYHLPENNPELPKNEEAKLASRAARIAFSSLLIRF